MEKVVHMHHSFYMDLVRNQEVNEILDREKISVLDGFDQNLDLVCTYYQKVYAEESNRVVLCGINPGRNGAGRTGIPFLDFTAVSHVLSHTGSDERERSAQFILTIINEMGRDFFYRNVYMTNISWLGFTKNGRNLNYYDLPSPLPTFFTHTFIEEMELVKPKVIVPLSERVEQTLKQMEMDGRLRYPIAKRLPHPYYCSIGRNAERFKEIYVNKINVLVNQH